MKSNVFLRVFVFFLLALLAGGVYFYPPAAGVVASQTDALPAKVEAGKVLDFKAESPHPATDGWTQTYTFTGAEFVRLHFKGFHLVEGDKLLVSSPDGAQTWEYSGKGSNQDGDFWSFAINGPEVKLTLSAPSGKSYGFHLVEVGYGTVPLEVSNPVPEIVVGTDGREDIACHTGDAVINAAQKPVARLLFTVKRTQYLCTGELVRGSNANTLITNAHCIDSQTVTSTLEARFNYQYTTCGGSTLAATTSFAGGTWLKTNAERYSARKASTTGLDYTLLTLQGTPEATFGELVPTSAIGAVGTQMNFIQHPAGLPKKIGYWEDSEHTVRCKIDTINQTYGASYPNSQTGYGCDSEGGSSGSAITRASDGKVIGLHHYGGVTTVLNSATMMSLICANAGSLLICDGN
jgi:V8-like Glu-specific endopeptidase